MPWEPDYITTAEFNAYGRVDGALDDVETALWITAASRVVDDHCNRQFGSVALQARVYRNAPVWVDALGLWVQQIDDVQSTTGMLIGGVALASAGAVLLPDNAPALGRPYTALGWTGGTSSYFPGPDGPAWTHTAPWGWLAVPNQVKAVTRLQTNRFASRRDSPLGVTEAPEGGTGMRLQTRIDPDLAVALRGLGRAGRPW